MTNTVFVVAMMLIKVDGGIHPVLRQFTGDLGDSREEVLGRSLSIVLESLPGYAIHAVQVAEVEPVAVAINPPRSAMMEFSEEVTQSLTWGDGDGGEIVIPTEDAAVTTDLGGLSPDELAEAEAALARPARA